MYLRCSPYTAEILPSKASRAALNVVSSSSSSSLLWPWACQSIKQGRINNTARILYAACFIYEHCTHLQQPSARNFRAGTGGGGGGEERIIVYFSFV